MMAQLMRRRTFSWGVALAALASVTPAFAGSYLDRAALLLSGARGEADFLRNRLSDRDLAEAVHKLATARLATASRMQVPKEVIQAHPHLILTLEYYERAAEAATRGDNAGFFKKQLEAREEERIFRGVLKQLGWTLPKL